MGFQEDVRGAAMTTLKAYADGASIALSQYPGRPATITPTHAFVDEMREDIVYVGHLMQRTVQADVVIVWGDFDTKAATEQKDAFVDGYIAYVRTNFHAAGASSTIGVVATRDEPTFVPAWIARPPTFYATVITLEGYRED